MPKQYEVIVVGKGNAAMCAALAARDAGADVVMLEAAPEEESGGNSRFAGGPMRFAFDSVEDLKKLTPLTDDEIATLVSANGTPLDEVCRAVIDEANARGGPDNATTVLVETVEGDEL